MDRQQHLRPQRLRWHLGERSGTALGATASPACMDGLKGNGASGAAAGAGPGSGHGRGSAGNPPPRGLGETFIPCFRANPWAGGAGAWGQEARQVPCRGGGAASCHHCAAGGGVWGCTVPLPVPWYPHSRDARIASCIPEPFLPFSQGCGDPLPPIPSDPTGKDTMAASCPQTLLEGGVPWAHPVPLCPLCSALVMLRPDPAPALLPGLHPAPPPLV